MISSHNTIHDICLPPYKKIKTCDDKYGDDALDMLFYELGPEAVPKENAPQDKLEEEINQALMSFNEYNSEGVEYMIVPKKEQPSTSISPECTASNEGSPFDSPESVSNSSVTSNEYEFKQHFPTARPEDHGPPPTINADTVMSIKQSMLNTSKLTSLFTTLKVTYLKLCKEFNYLLAKFNENEKIKIELIQENNELKNLLTEIIKDRELDRKNFKRELQAEKALHKMCNHRH